MEKFGAGGKRAGTKVCGIVWQSTPTFPQWSCQWGGGEGELIWLYPYWLKDEMHHAVWKCQCEQDLYRKPTDLCSECVVIPGLSSISAITLITYRTPCPQQTALRPMDTLFVSVVWHQGSLWATPVWYCDVEFHWVIHNNSNFQWQWNSTMTLYVNDHWQWHFSLTLRCQLLIVTAEQTKVIFLHVII